MISALFWGGGALYAGEVALSDAARPFAPVSGEASSSLEALQFEIDFVDSVLVARSRGLEAKQGADRVRSSLQALANASVSEMGTSQDSRFWQDFDRAATQHSMLLEAEHRLLNGAVSSIIERRSEFRAANPLRDLRESATGGESAGTQRGGSAFQIGFVTGERAAPRLSVKIAGLPEHRRSVDVRSGLHLHAIRNGYLSKAGNAISVFPARLASIRPFAPAFASPLSFFDSFVSRSAFAALLSSGGDSFRSTTLSFIAALRPAHFFSTSLAMSASQSFPRRLFAHASSPVLIGVSS
ncbi:MAG: hypothetical protein NXI24_22815 [bacterium]|nr:hypothetical protein [bacterium]